MQWRYQRLRIRGEQDAFNGLPIENFYNLRLKRHYESLRAEYEIGYRAAKAQMERERSKGEKQC